MELLYEIFSMFWYDYLDKKGIVNEKGKTTVTREVAT